MYTAAGYRKMALPDFCYHLCSSLPNPDSHGLPGAVAAQVHSTSRVGRATR